MNVDAYRKALADERIRLIREWLDPARIPKSIVSFTLIARFDDNFVAEVEVHKSPETATTAAPEPEPNRTNPLVRAYQAARHALKRSK